MIETEDVPDLHTIQTRLDSLEQRMSALVSRQEKFEGHMEERFDEVISGINTLYP